jgi:hypothetical protein
VFRFAWCIEGNSIFQLIFFPMMVQIIHMPTFGTIIINEHNGNPHRLPTQHLIYKFTTSVRPFVTELGCKSSRPGPARHSRTCTWASYMLYIKSLRLCVRDGARVHHKRTTGPGPAKTRFGFRRTGPSPARHCDGGQRSSRSGPAQQKRDSDPRS